MREVPTALDVLFERLGVIFEAPVAGLILESMTAPKRTGYFSNPLIEGEYRNPGEPIDELDACFSVSVDGRADLLESEGVAAGAIYPINPSSVLAVRNLDVAGAGEVLDLAAAPGGKTLLMAAAMDNLGRIAAVEPVKGRFFRMRANLARCGVTNVQFYQADGRSIGRKVPGRFDRVLLDAPCSSEARIRLNDAGTYSHWKPRKIKESARKQRGLIRSAYAALKPGGEMVYCTCSFAPEENELVVDHLLKGEPDAELMAVKGPGSTGPQQVRGLTEWQGKALDSRLAVTLRVVPDDLWDGFFLARIRKSA